LRRRFRALRRALDPREQRAHAELAARHAVASPLFWGARAVALYLPADGELSPLPLAERLARQGVTLALPVVTITPGRGPHLVFRRWNPGAPLVRNRYGIPEPAATAPRLPLLGLDRLVVPLVGFDDQGSRLGMGAGFYDRTLSALPANLRPRLFGYAHALQRSADVLPTAHWDIPLDSVVTEAGITLFRTGAAGAIVR
jgi:5-formyltetrahydrofolate cyclo-ligase